MQVTAGAHSAIRVWDVERCLSVQDIVSETSERFVATSLSHHYGSPLFVVGYDNGALEIFDSRSPPKYGSLQMYQEHRTPILNAKIPHSVSGNLIISGAAAGEVKLWDLRQTGGSVRSLQMHARGMSAFDVHNHSPIFST